MTISPVLQKKRHEHLSSREFFGRHIHYIHTCKCVYQKQLLFHVLRKKYSTLTIFYSGMFASRLGLECMTEDNKAYNVSCFDILSLCKKIWYKQDCKSIP